MSVNGNGLLYALPLFFYILSRMIHPIFIVFIIIYFIALFFMYQKQAMSILLCFVGLSFLFRIPEPVSHTTIKGTVVEKDDKSITVKEGYFKTLVYGEFDDVKMYDEIELEGSPYTLLPPTNQYGFHYQYYLYSKNIFQVLTHKHTIKHTPKKHIYHVLEKKINQNEQSKSVVSLFILGVKDETMEEEYDKLASLSLVHLFALSGMHIQMLKKWLKSFLKYVCQEFYQELISLILIGIYLLMIPYNISFLRAYLMMVLMFLLNKYLSQLDLFSFLTVGMLYFNPYLLFNMSFVFSYTIYFFIILLNNHSVSRYYIFLSTIPLVLMMNYKIPIYSLITGVLLLPFIQYLYQAILYSFILGNVISPLIQMIYTLFMSMVDFVSYFSLYIIFPRPTLLFVCVYYYLYIKGIYFLTLGRRPVRQISCLIGLLVAFYLTPYYNFKTQVTMIDVGQGDCCLISQPFNKGNVLIDTGGMKNRDLAKETIIPYLYSQGIRSLDAVFISHDDFDHCGALESLEKNIKIEKIVYEFENEKIGDIVFQNLSYKNYSESNDNSTVIYATINDLNYLFTGDASAIVEKDLYDRYQHLDVDVLKVGHHGSSTSSSNDLFKMIQPKIALIGVGRNNFYKHPHPSVIARLESYDVSIYRTDLHGMIRIIGYGNRHYIYTTMQPNNVR